MSSLGRSAAPVLVVECDSVPEPERQCVFWDVQVSIEHSALWAYQPRAHGDESEVELYRCCRSSEVKGPQR